MRRSKHSGALICAALVGLTGCAAMPQNDPKPALPAQTAGILQLRVLLRDGSLVNGTPAQDVLPFTSSLGDMKLSLSNVSSLQTTNSSSQWLIRFRNGDQLCGTLTVKDVPLMTSFGGANIPLGCISGITVITPAKKDSNRDLVLSYSFDQPEDGLISNTVSAKHQAVNHGAEWIESGKRGGGLRFRNRPASLEIPNDPELNFGRDDFSYAVWLRIDNIGDTQQVVDHSYNPELQVEPSGQLMVYYAFRFCGRLSSKESIQPRKWYFVVFERSDGIGKLFINGDEDGQVDAHDCDASNTAPLTVGRNAGGGEQLHGDLDELRIWRRALSADEVRSLYEAER